MEKQTKHSKTLLLSTLLLVGASILGSTNVISHEHDLLAQCQLPNGKWKMCDDTIHDLKSNKHVLKDNVAKGATKLKAKTNTAVKINKIKAKGSPAAGAQLPKATFGIPFSANCANGFTKAGQQKLGNGDMDWYVCSTPVLTCPSYTQTNGLKAHVTPKAIVQMIGGSPDSGGPQKFRVQYKCDYSFNAQPEG